MMGPSLLGVLGVRVPRVGGGRSIYRRSIFWKQRPRMSPLTCLLRVRAPLIQLIREMYMFARWGGGDSIKIENLSVDAFETYYSGNSYLQWGLRAAETRFCRTFLY